MPNPEGHARINHLFHLAHIVLLECHRDLRQKNPNLAYFTPAFLKKHLEEPTKLAQNYVKTLKEIAKKLVIRL